MARLNKKQRRQKKWNNKFIKQIRIKNDIVSIKKEIADAQSSDKEITEEEFSKITKEVGKAITKGLLPKFKFIEGEPVKIEEPENLNSVEEEQ